MAIVSKKETAEEVTRSHTDLDLDPGGKKGGSIIREDCWGGDVQEPRPSRMSGSKMSMCVHIGRQVGRCVRGKGR